MQTEWCMPAELLSSFRESVGHSFCKVIKLILLVLDKIAQSRDILGLGALRSKTTRSAISTTWFNISDSMISRHGADFLNSLISLVQATSQVILPDIVIVWLIHIYLKTKYGSLFLFACASSIVVFCGLWWCKNLRFVRSIEVPRFLNRFLVPRRHRMTDIDWGSQVLSDSKSSSTSHTICSIAFALDSIDNMHSFIKQFLKSNFIILAIFFTNCFLYFKHKHIAGEVYVCFWVSLSIFGDATVHPWWFFNSWISPWFVGRWISESAWVHCLVMFRLFACLIWCYVWFTRDLCMDFGNVVSFLVKLWFHLFIALVIRVRIFRIFCCVFLMPTFYFNVHRACLLISRFSKFVIFRCRPKLWGGFFCSLLLVLACFSFDYFGASFLGNLHRSLIALAIRIWQLVITWNWNLKGFLWSNLRRFLLLNFALGLSLCTRVVGCFAVVSWFAWALWCIFARILFIIDLLPGLPSRRFFLVWCVNFLDGYCRLLSLWRRWTSSWGSWTIRFLWRHCETCSPRNFKSIW